MTLTNDVAELCGVVDLTSADVTLDTDRRDCSFKWPYFSVWLGGEVAIGLVP